LIGCFDWELNYRDVAFLLEALGATSLTERFKQKYGCVADLRNFMRKKFELLNDNSGIWTLARKRDVILFSRKDFYAFLG